MVRACESDESFYRCFETRIPEEQLDYLFGHGREKLHFPSKIDHVRQILLTKLQVTTFLTTFLLRKYSIQRCTAK